MRTIVIVTLPGGIAPLSPRLVSTHTLHRLRAIFQSHCQGYKYSSLTSGKINDATAYLIHENNITFAHYSTLLPTSGVRPHVT